ncbi:MAG TPA: response regulator transcription factor [Burkholderiaceae bacterium]|nr:response regulator transcription factor [Burkholderiaceae bacterium]
MQVPVRAALVSNSPLVLAGLKDGLEQRGDFEIVCVHDSLAIARADSFGEARVCIADLGTDADLRPIAEIAEQGPALVLLGADRDGPIADWLAAGISLLPRDASIEAVAIAAHAACAGLVASCAKLAAQAVRAGLNADRPALAGEVDPLTPREREVLLKMSLGLGNRQIAQALHISAHTAKFHVAQIIAKLDATSRAHAVAKAMRSGLVEL